MQKQVASSFKIIKKHREVSEDTPVIQINQPVEFLMKVLRSQEYLEFEQRSIQSLSEQKGVSKHEAIIGHGTLTNSLEKIILEMKVGQIWQVLNCYQSTQNQNHLLIQVLCSKQSVGAKKSPIQHATQLKEVGNISVKSKDYPKAKQAYIEAFKLVQFNCTKQVEQLKLSLISNLSLCCNNLSLYQQSIRWCNRHLNESEEPNKKIVYRKAAAQKGLKKWEDAKGTIQGALKRWDDADTQSDFKSLMENLMKDQIQQNKKEKAVYSKMFS